MFLSVIPPDVLSLALRDTYLDLIESRTLPRFPSLTEVEDVISLVLNPLVC